MSAVLLACKLAVMMVDVTEFLLEMMWAIWKVKRMVAY
jgi:hypothetical protein